MLSEFEIHALCAHSPGVCNSNIADKQTQRALVVREARATHINYETLKMACWQQESLCAALACITIGVRSA
jgi:hypothetical protein